MKLPWTDHINSDICGQVENPKTSGLRYRTYIVGVHPPLAEAIWMLTRIYALKTPRPDFFGSL